MIELIIILECQIPCSSADKYTGLEDAFEKCTCQM